MIEREFVTGLIKGAKKELTAVVTYRASDRATIGVPDLLVWAKLVNGQRYSGAVEAKQIRPLMADPWRRGHRTGLMLKHPFTGPQISMLLKLVTAGVDACGLVRVSADTAFRIEPDVIPAKTGNFTYDEMVAFGTAIVRERGVWRFWRTDDDQVPGARHRDDS
jgi:hypothetical protein